MQTLIAFTLFILVVHSSSLNSDLQLFNEFKLQFGKTYDSQEETHRFAIFKDNLRTISDLGRKHPDASFGITKFADLTLKEFTNIQRVEPAQPSSSPRPNHLARASACNHNRVSFNYSSCGVIGPVENQGECGSSLVITAVEEVESYCALAGFLPFVELSVQQVIDCLANGSACNGYIEDFGDVYEYIETYGLETESSYPYQAEAGDCMYNKSAVYPCSIKGYITLNSEDAIFRHLSSKTGGPVAAFVDAGSSEWQFYQSGILSSCGSQVDDAIQVLGYGLYGSSKSYWVVKQSWGADWGMDGFAWISTAKCPVSGATYPYLA